MTSSILAWLGRRTAAADHLEIESNSDGIRQLYDGGGAPSVDICFVHGLAGNRIQTWKASERLLPWPQDLLPIDVPDARIVTFGYDAFYIKGLETASNTRLLDHANSLLVDLQNDREEQKAVSRPLIFVAHSMGGLVCKRAILTARNHPDARFRDIFSSLRGIIFLGTPHFGSWIADWARIPISAISRFKSANTSLIDILQTDDQQLESLNVDFMGMIREQRESGRELGIYCFFEGRKTPVVGDIVSKASATFPGYDECVIPADHVNMAKVSSANENGYNRLAATIKRWNSRSPLHQTDKACLQALRVVTPADYIQRLEKNNEPFLTEVSDWFLSSEPLVSFLGRMKEDENTRTSCRLVWLEGPSGTGKTMLLLGTLRHIERQRPNRGFPLPSLSYYFCDKINRKWSNPTTVLRSLIWMLLDQQPQLIHHLRARYDTSGPSLFTDGLAFYALSDIFRAILRDTKLQESYFIVDALEQCQKPALMQFYQLIQESLHISQRVKWLVSSQLDKDIQANFRETSGNRAIKSLVSVPYGGAEESVSIYIRHKLSQLEAECGYNSKAIEKISSDLASQSQKNFASLSSIFQQLHQVPEVSDVQRVEQILSNQKPPQSATTFSAARQSLEGIVASFQARLNDSALFKMVSTTNTTMEKTWETIARVQGSQSLRGLGRISQFLDRLKDYDGAIHDLVGTPSGISALIWGPIGCLLELSSPTPEPFEALVKSFASVGETIPPFPSIREAVDDEDKIQELLSLFVQDILEFHLICLTTVGRRSSHLFFEPLLAQHDRQVISIISHLNHHASLITSTVTLEQIRKERAARMDSIHKSKQESTFQYRREFQALRSRMLSYTYEEVFDRTENRLCDGTTAWLMKDELYIQWKDTAERSTALLWLNGNPGSGKTFLAAAAVADVKLCHNCLYIFASYEQGNKTTAKSILQSLIFQAAHTNEMLQTLLVDMDERELTKGMKATVVLLKRIVQSFGPFYIVIDGLDEVDESERSMVLELLLDVSQSCKDVRLLISARPEYDIESKLKKPAKEILVHHRNSGSIQLYVNQRTPEILATFSADKAAKAEIESLLIHLTPTAKGMFLYAKIVIDTLHMLSSLHEVRNYLEDLPSKLDEVYRRVTQRINELPQRERRKARRIIGWVGCAPVPMTAREIEQALLIQADGVVPPATGAIRFVQLCGPVVEVSDDCVRFVHFTFKEYIFSPTVDHYINRLDANWDLARTCLSYLCSEVFDVGISRNKIAQNILDGKYRLQAYATTVWSTMLKQVVSDKEALGKLEEIVKILEHLADVRHNIHFKPSSETVPVLLADLKSKSYKAHKLLQETIQFRQNKKWIDWNFQNASLWVHRDPLTMSQIICRIHDEYQECLYPTKTEREQIRDTLKRHYGPALFKCTFPACNRNRQGFPTPEDCYNHTKNHSRPWKCSQSNCEFSIIGFESADALHRHASKCMIMGHTPQLRTESIEVEELKVLLFEAIRQENLVQLRLLLSSPNMEVIEDSDRTPPFPDTAFSDELAILAAQKGSLTMLEAIRLRFGEDEDLKNRHIAIAAAKSGNTELFQWLLSRASFSKGGHKEVEAWYEEVARLVLQMESDGLYSQWEDYLFYPEFGGHGRRWARGTFAGLLWEYEKTEVVFSAPSFNAIRGRLTLENRLIRTWRRFEERGLLNPAVLSYALKNVASSTFSLTLAKELLRMGADTTFPKPGYRLKGQLNAQKTGETSRTRAAGKTVLHTALSHSSFEAAEFVQWLLENGADPFQGYANHKPEKEIGARTIERHLGLTWSKLLERHGWKRGTRRKVSKVLNVR